MKYFKKKLSGYTLLELIITISISAFLLMLCFSIHQNQHKKILSQAIYSIQKECLDFFTKTTKFIGTAVRFEQKDAQTLALDLVPNAQHPQGWHLEIQLNGQHREKNMLSIASPYIQAFSWFYWDSQAKKWVKFDLGTSYTHKRFIKVILKDKTHKTLDTFIYPCYTDVE